MVERERDRGREGKDKDSSCEDFEYAIDAYTHAMYGVR